MCMKTHEIKPQSAPGELSAIINVKELQRHCPDRMNTSRLICISLSACAKMCGFSHKLALFITMYE